VFELEAKVIETTEETVPVEVKRTQQTEERDKYRF